MNRIITLPVLVELLSKQTGKDKETCEKFIMDFSQTLADGLADGEAVKIKGLGEFSVGENAKGQKKVVFAPDKTLADTLNEPFNCFLPVELAPEVTAEMLAGEIPAESPVAESPVSTPQPEVPDVEVEAPMATQLPPKFVASKFASTQAPSTTVSDDPSTEESTAEVAIDVPETVPVAESTTVTEIEDPQPEITVEEEVQTEPVEAEMVEYPQPEPVEPDYEGDIQDTTEVKRTFPWGWIAFTALLALVIGFGAAFLLHDKLNVNNSGTLDTADPEIEEGVEVVLPETEIDLAPSEPAGDLALDTLSAQAVGQPVETETPATDQSAAQTAPDLPEYDIVASNRFLTTMAREYYGDKVYWVYIYLDNPNLGNPNTVAAGTKVHIPKRSKYDVSADEAVNRKSAVQMGAKIVNQYQ